MPLETAQYIAGLNPNYPALGDTVSQGDDHMRLLKQVMVNTFPKLSGQVTKTHAQINAAPHDLATLVALLGFTPTQQGGATGLDASVPVMLGWNGTKLQAAVGPTKQNLGSFLFDNDFLGGNQTLGNFNGATYQLLTGGLAVQTFIFNANSESTSPQVYSATFPTPFKNRCLYAIVTPANGAKESFWGGVYATVETADKNHIEGFTVAAFGARDWRVLAFGV